MLGRSLNHCKVLEEISRGGMGIVHRCLGKDADDRYQTAKDLLSELRRFARNSDSQRTAATTAQRVNGGPDGAHVVIGMGVLAALFVGGLFLLPRVDTTFKVPRLLNPRQITFDAGAESMPSASQERRSSGLHVIAKWRYGLCR